MDKSFGDPEIKETEENEFIDENQIQIFENNIYEKESPSPEKKKDSKAKFKKIEIVYHLILIIGLIITLYIWSLIMCSYENKNILIGVTFLFHGILFGLTINNFLLSLLNGKSNFWKLLKVNFNSDIFKKKTIVLCIIIEILSIICYIIFGVIVKDSLEKSISSFIIFQMILVILLAIISLIYFHLVMITKKDLTEIEEAKEKMKKNNYSTETNQYLNFLNELSLRKQYFETNNQTTQTLEKSAFATEENEKGKKPKYKKNILRLSIIESILSANLKDPIFSINSIFKIFLLMFLQNFSLLLFFYLIPLCKTLIKNKNEWHLIYVTIIYFTINKCFRLIYSKNKILKIHIGWNIIVRSYIYAFSIYHIIFYFISMHGVFLFLIFFKFIYKVTSFIIYGYYSFEINEFFEKLSFFLFLKSKTSIKTAEEKKIVEDFNFKTKIITRFYIMELSEIIANFVYLFVMLTFNSNINKFNFFKLIENERMKKIILYTFIQLILDFILIIGTFIIFLKKKLLTEKILIESGIRTIKKNNILNLVIDYLFVYGIIFIILLNNFSSWDD